MPLPKAEQAFSFSPFLPPPVLQAVKSAGS